ncbi:MAG: DinB family protein [Dehalococcoidia bacterium]
MHVADMMLLYAYNRWANQRLIAAAKLVNAEQFLATFTFPHGSLRNTLAHVIRTEWAWCAVLRGESSDQPPTLRNEELPTAAVIEARWNAIQAETQSFIASLHDADLGRVMRLKSGGALTVWQVLINLYTHSVQHRGEVAQILTDHGCSPGDIDYLFFALEQPIP